MWTPTWKCLTENLNSNWSDINLNGVYLFMRHKNHSIEFDGGNCWNATNVSNRIKSNQNQIKPKWFGETNTHSMPICTMIAWILSLLVLIGNHWINSQDRKYQLFSWFHWSQTHWRRQISIVKDDLFLKLEINHKQHDDIEMSDNEKYLEQTCWLMPINNRSNLSNECAPLDVCAIQSGPNTLIIWYTEITYHAHIHTNTYTFFLKDEYINPWLVFFA